MSTQENSDQAFDLNKLNDIPELKRYFAMVQSTIPIGGHAASIGLYGYANSTYACMLVEIGEGLGNQENFCSPYKAGKWVRYSTYKRRLWVTAIKLMAINIGCADDRKRTFRGLMRFLSSAHPMPKCLT